MALIWKFSSPFILSNSSFHQRNILVCDMRLITSQQPIALTDVTKPTTLRRSANYQPSLWSYDYVQSLGSKYTVRVQITFNLKCLCFQVSVFNLKCICFQVSVY